MDKVEEVKSETSAVSFKFNFSQKSGRHVVVMDEVTKSYGDIEVLKSSSIGLERGDKVALIGANGIGKSTLLRCFNRMNDLVGQCSIQGAIELEGKNIYVMGSSKPLKFNCENLNFSENDLENLARVTNDLKIRY